MRKFLRCITLGHPDMRGPACIFMMVADALVPKRHQGISNYNADSTAVSFGVLWIISLLTHCCQVICVGKLTKIGSDNGLSPGWPQAINWTSAGILSIERLGTNFSEILIEMKTFSFKENEFENGVCEMASILSRPQCVKHIMFEEGRKLGTPSISLLFVGSLSHGNNYLCDPTHTVPIGTHFKVPHPFTCLGVAKNRYWYSIFIAMKLRVVAKAFY